VCPQCVYVTKNFDDFKRQHSQHAVFQQKKNSFLHLIDNINNISDTTAESPAASPLHSTTINNISTTADIFESPAASPPQMSPITSESPPSPPPSPQPAATRWQPDEEQHNHRKRQHRVHYPSLPRLPNTPHRHIVEEELNGAYRNVRFTTNSLVDMDEDCHDVSLTDFFCLIDDDVKDMMHFFQEHDVKIQFILIVELVKKLPANNPEVEEEEEKVFNAYISLPAQILDTEETWESTKLALERKLDEWTRYHTGATLKSVLHLDAILVRYDSVRHYIGRGGDDNTLLPMALRHQNGIVNVRNGTINNHCFLYAILAQLHYDEITPDTRFRVSVYKRWEGELQVNGIEFPFKVKDAAKFERANPHLALNILQWSEKYPFPRILRPAPKSSLSDACIRIVNILLLLDTNHYVAITNLDRVLNSRRSLDHSHTAYHCPRCLKPFTTKILRSAHQCSDNVQNFEMPQKKEYKFNSWHKTESPAYIIYADIECLLEKPDAPATTNSASTSSSVPLQIHTPIAVAYFLVPSKELGATTCLPPEYHEFVGENCMAEFLCSLESTAKRVFQWNETHARTAMKSLTPEEKTQFEETSACYICKKEIADADQKCRDHSHLTGQYRGVACGDCNRRKQYHRVKLTVVMHNFKNYDVHHVCRMGLSAMKHWKVSVIPITFEKYLMLQANFALTPSPHSSSSSSSSLSEKQKKKKKKHHYGSLTFIDSYQFLTSSLAKLVAICPNMSYTQSLTYLSDSVKLGKGVFPYDYFSNTAVLEETSLPKREAFFDVLEERHLSEGDYARALLAWEEGKCTTLRDYLLLYLRLDVYQICDVFENFRHLSIREDGLDPVHYFSTPGLAWDACFQRTGVEIDLLLQEDQYQFFEKGCRGGMTFVNKHRVCRNSPEDIANTQWPYNPNLPHVELLYVDVNNLYGHALTKPLPKCDFRWEEDGEAVLRFIKNKVMQESDSTWWEREERGYVLEVDIVIPDALHDALDDLPLAPERVAPCSEFLTDWMHQQWARVQSSSSSSPTKFRSTEKLLLTHVPKKNYVIHFALLQYFLRLGAEVSTVHRCMSFQQERIFQSFIDFNSKKRAESDNEFEKDYYKLKNNSLYGKTVEDVRKRRDIRLCNGEEKLVRYTSKATFYAARKFATGVVGVQLLKETILLNKPVYIGMSVLDISKLEMYELRYTHLKMYANLFGGDIHVVGGDTDSLILEVVNINLETQLLPQMVRDELLDTSNYDRSHILYSEKCKARLGCIKDESKGRAYAEILLVRAKCYSILFLTDVASSSSPLVGHKRCKGIQRSVVATKIAHSDYVTVYESSLPSSSTDHEITFSPPPPTKDVTVRRFGCHLHQVKTVKERKRALVMFDDKRGWVSANCSMAYGHFKLRRLQ
jgi:hypothetical protein